MNPERWGWLVYALNYRAPDVRNSDSYTVLDLTIEEKSLTKADMSAIVAALETGYPQASRESERMYGFADVDEGAQLGFSEFLNDSGNFQVASCNFRCRASYEAANSGVVDIVVPGYGVCTTKLDDSIQFTPDMDKLYVEKHRICECLNFYFDRIDDIVDLLRVLFRGIRSLSIHVYDGSEHQTVVDLSVLSAVCPRSARATVLWLC